jgi:hypothetical protein
VTSNSYIQELAYLDSVVVVVVVVVISIAVESEVNHLLRMRQKFPEREEGLVILLTSEALWHQKSADTRKGLTPEKGWHQKRADTRSALAPEKCWHQKSADTRKALAPANAK